jgi:hypothetical protein
VRDGSVGGPAHAALVTPTTAATDPRIDFAIDDLVTWALVEQTGAGRQNQHQAMVRRLHQALAVLTARRGLPEDEALGWLRVAVGAPDPGTYQTMILLLTESPLQRSLNAWRSLGALGPLAYAAGLNAEEAHEQHEAGTLHAARLVALAGLQGWRFHSSIEAARPESQ